jgi:glutaryl-CoA transferase
VQPLSGLKVLDFTTLLPGPLATLILAEAGADVLKIERPGSGDDMRSFPPTISGESVLFALLNRAKRSLALDLKVADAWARLEPLIAGADVLVEQFRPGVMDRLGLGYDRLKAVNPRLIYCSITGYGQDGPYAARPGYDLMAQGTGGIMSVTGEADGPPVKVGVAVNDVMSGLYAAVAILGALRHRDRTGRGQHIDIALLDVQVGWLYNVGLNHLLSGAVPRRWGTAHPNTVPYQVFPTSDGHVILGANNDAQFRRLCECAGAPELAADPRFATNALRLRHRVELIDIVSALTRKQTTQHWVDGLEAAGLPCGPVNTIDRVFDDPQVRHRGMKIAMAHPAGEAPLIGSPLKLSETPVSYRRPPPTLGEHTDEVLEQLLGLGVDECRALRTAGVI